MLVEAQSSSVSPPLTGVRCPEQVGLQGLARPAVSLEGSQGLRHPANNENKWGNSQGERGQRRRTVPDTGAE